MRGNLRRLTRAIAMAAITAIVSVSCADDTGITDPHPTPLPPPLLPPAEVGGDTAIQQIAATIARLDREGRGHEVPDGMRALVRDAETRARTELTPTYLYGIPEEGELAGPIWIDGTEYYQEGGELIPPRGKEAEIRQAYTMGILEPGRADVSAIFQYVGHGATQDMTFTISSPTTGKVIMHRPLGPFGSARSQWLGYIQWFSGQHVARDLPKCDITLSAYTIHYAWYNKFWDFGTRGSASTGSLGVELIREKKGAVERSSRISPETAIRCFQFSGDDCAEGDDDGGSEGETGMVSRAPATTASLSCEGSGGGFDDEGSCTICQQWFRVYMGVIIEEWWECWESPNDPTCTAFYT